MAIVHAGTKAPATPTILLILIALGVALIGPPAIAQSSGPQSMAITAISTACERLATKLFASILRSDVLKQRLQEERQRSDAAHDEVLHRDGRIRQLTDSLVSTEAVLADEVRLATQAQSLVSTLSTQIDELRSQLTRAESARIEAEARITDRDFEIANLAARLNQARVRQMSEIELGNSRSELLSRLHDVVGIGPDMLVVGESFVVQSEILFPPASDILNEGGKAQLAAIATVLLDTVGGLPPELDWILRVDGHTDNRPIRTPQFPSNWELSTARATEVVRFLVEQGIPPERLAAAGFAEFQPLDPGTSQAAFARNRRIELTLDQR